MQVLFTYYCLTKFLLYSSVLQSSIQVSESCLNSNHLVQIINRMIGLYEQIKAHKIKMFASNNHAMINKKGTSNQSCLPKTYHALFSEDRVSQCHESQIQS